MKPVYTLLAVAVFLVWIAPPATAQKKRAHKKATVTSLPSNMLSMLQGRWSSLDDKKTFFHIEGNRQIDIYGRDILDSATINFYDECPNRISAEDEKRKSGKYLIVELKPNDFYCYSIEKISPQQLVLMYLPKGSILKYKKVAAKKLSNGNPLEDHED